MKLALERAMAYQFLRLDQAYVEFCNLFAPCLETSGRIPLDSSGVDLWGFAWFQVNMCRFYARPFTLTPMAEQINIGFRPGFR